MNTAIWAYCGFSQIENLNKHWKLIIILDFETLSQEAFLMPFVLKWGLNKKFKKVLNETF